MEAHEIDWRNSLGKGDVIDVVKHDLQCSLESWSRGEIIDVLHGTELGKNLGDGDGYNIKRFEIKYSRDASAGTKLFPANSSQIAMFDTKSSGEEWRYNVQVGDRVDTLSAYQEWSTTTVVKKDASDTDPLPMITVGYREYKADGDMEDEMGRYTGKPAAFDARIPLYSIRVQQPHTVAKEGVQDGGKVWRFKPLTPTTGTSQSVS